MYLSYLYMHAYIESIYIYIYIYIYYISAHLRIQIYCTYMYIATLTLGACLSLLAVLLRCLRPCSGNRRNPGLPGNSLRFRRLSTSTPQCTPIKGCMASARCSQNHTCTCRFQDLGLLAFIPAHCRRGSDKAWLSAFWAALGDEGSIDARDFEFYE